MNKPRVVVITGASAGVGRATARAFAREGASIGLIARGRAGLEGARRDVEALGGRALVLPLDVADANAIEEAAAEVEKSLGPIDVWVNVAMASVFSPIKKMTAEEFKRVTEVTYLGYVYGTLAALKRMLPRDKGVIIQVGSALAYRGIPLQAAYCASKHAIQGFCDSLRCELLHDRSHVRRNDDSNAGLEHSAIQLGEKPFTAQGAASAADLRTGNCRARNHFRVTSSTPRNVCRTAHGRSHCRR